MNDVDDGKESGGDCCLNGRMDFVVDAALRYVGVLVNS